MEIQTSSASKIWKKSIKILSSVTQHDCLEIKQHLSKHTICFSSLHLGYTYFSKLIIYDVCFLTSQVLVII